MKLPSGQTVPLPPIVLAAFVRDPEKATLCIYGHVDVQPARREDGWNTDPFTLTEISGRDNADLRILWVCLISTQGLHI